MFDGTPIFIGVGLAIGMIGIVVYSWRKIPKCWCGKRHTKRPASMTAADFVEHFCGDHLGAWQMRMRERDK